MKALAAKVFASYINKKNKKWINHPIASQKKVFKDLIKKGSKTAFGTDHDFGSIKSFADFFQRVPINDYEALRPYVDRMVAGEKNILWPGKPLYFAKTSGTTSGAKYIPISKESMPTHITAARDALLNYIYKTGKAGFVNGKHIFVQGSPVLDDLNGVALGRLSGIVAHYVPSYLQKNRMPSWKTNTIDDWETKVNAIVSETVDKDMTVIGGIPSWVQMYFERLTQKSDQKVGTLFPNFSLFVYGGVNFEPYRSVFDKLIGRGVDQIELFPASEGFFAYQDQLNEKGLLLLVDNGIFYEFIEAAHFYDPSPKRLTLEEVTLDVNYVLIISTTAGLWGYNIGDTVQFTSLSPFRIIVSGRIKHFISAFGEHVIGSEVEKALEFALNESKETIAICEFTVAPQINPEEGLPYHEWFIEFDDMPKDLLTFQAHIDTAMNDLNIYYKDLIVGSVLRPLVIQAVQKGGFASYMKSIGKLGGQNKVPRLSNDRKIATGLQSFLYSET